MWVYMNPHPPSHLAYSKESNILTYGYTDEDDVQHVKPMIRYYGGGGGDDVLTRLCHLHMHSLPHALNRFHV